MRSGCPVRSLSYSSAAAGSAAERIASLENEIDALNRTSAEREDQLEALVRSRGSAIAEYETKLATALRLGRQEMDAQGTEIARLGAEADSGRQRATELEDELSAPHLTGIPSVFQAAIPPAVVLRVKTTSDWHRLPTIAYVLSAALRRAEVSHG